MLTALVLVSQLALADIPPAAKNLGVTSDQWTKLAAGEAVSKTETYKTAEGKDAGRGRAFIVIKGTPKACYDVVHKYEDAPQFLPRVKKVTFLEKGDLKMRVTQEIKVALSTYRYTMIFNFEPDKNAMHWTLDKSVKNDIADTTGGWNFYDLGDGKTLLDYQVAADTGAAVPRFLSDYFTQKDLPNVLENFRKRVESGGTWQKD